MDKNPSLKVIKQILDYAIWAPSGDNSQPWRFEVAGNILKVFNLPGRDNPYLNFRQRGSLIAHGGLFENIIIAAPHFGYEAHIALFPSEDDQNLVAKISFRKNKKAKKDNLFNFIKQRHTNRHFYASTPLSNQQRKELLRTPKEVGFGKVKLMEDENGKKILGRAAASAEIVILENKLLHHYLFKDIVWSQADEEKYKSGLYINTMEFNPIQKFLFRMAKHWQLMKLATRIGLPEFIAKQDSKLYASGAAIGVITTAQDGPEDFVNAGRLMQRIWLKTTAYKLALQPITATLFLAQRILSSKTENILADEHIDLMKKAYADIQKAFGLQHETIAMMFRIGKARPASARSSRLPVDEKLTFKIP